MEVMADMAMDTDLMDSKHNYSLMTYFIFIKINKLTLLIVEDMVGYGGYGYYG